MLIKLEKLVVYICFVFVFSIDKLHANYSFHLRQGVYVTDAFISLITNKITPKLMGFSERFKNC